MRCRITNNHERTPRHLLHDTRVVCDMEIGTKETCIYPAPPRWCGQFNWNSRPHCTYFKATFLQYIPLASMILSTLRHCVMMPKWKQIMKRSIPENCEIIPTVISPQCLIRSRMCFPFKGKTATIKQRPLGWVGFWVCLWVSHIAICSVTAFND